MCARNAKSRFGSNIQARQAKLDHFSVIYYDKGNSQAKSSKGQKQNITPKPGDQIKKWHMQIQNTRGITQGPQREKTSQKCWDEGTHGA